MMDSEKRGEAVAASTLGKDRLAPPGPRQAVWRGATADKYLGAGLQEAFADAPANPFAAAGDQHHFAAEIQGVVHMV